MAETLELWLRHYYENLIIVMPPRHGKTEGASRATPAWSIGHDPTKKFIAASNAQSLADKNSRDVKRLLAHPNHIATFGETRLTKATDAEWETEQGGSYRAVGVGGGIAGHGADYVIIDDPTLTRRSVESPAERDHQYQWLLDDILTRRHRPSSILLMATRWHEDDLIGRVLNPEYGTGDHWHVLHLPKSYEEFHRPNNPDVTYLDLDPRTEVGECLLSPFALMPWEYLPGMPEPPVDRFLKRQPVQVTYEELQAREREAYERRKAKNPYGVSALEQGNPVPKDGGLIQANWFKRYTADPQEVAESADRLVISIDAAFKGNASSDQCSLVVVAKKGNFLLVIDEDTDRMSWSVLKARAKAMVEKYPHALVLIEDKANGTALLDELKLVAPRLQAFEPSKFGSKEARAQFAADRYSSSTILHPVPAKAPWIDAFELELASFPYGSNDDRVDAVSQAVLFLDRKKSGSDIVGGITNSLYRLFGG